MGRKQISILYLIGIASILFGLCHHFVHFQSNVPKSVYDSGGIFVSAFLLLGGKSLFFLCALLAWCLLERFLSSSLLRLWLVGCLLALFSLMLYWIWEMKQTLQYASMNEVNLQMGSGFILVCIGFILVLLHLCRQMQVRRICGRRM